MSPLTLIRTFAVLTLATVTAGPPANAHETAAEAANKQVVLDFYRALDRANADGAMRDRIQGIAEKYLGPDYIQHAEAFIDLPGPGTARDRLVRMFQNRPALNLPPATTLAVMAEGDRVMMLTSREMPDQASGATKTAYVFNMFRLKDHRLVEHWDVNPLAPPGGMPPAAPPPGTH